MGGKAEEAGEAGSRSDPCVLCCASWALSQRLVTVSCNKSIHDLGSRNVVR